MEGENMKIGIPAEIFKGESRIALAPKSVADLKKLGAEILVESGAGALAHFSDEEFKAAGAEITKVLRRLSRNSAGTPTVGG